MVHVKVKWASKAEKGLLEGRDREGERWRESTWEAHADKGFWSVALRGESM